MEDALIKRIQPNSIEAEASVIGAMLKDRDAIIAAQELLTAEDFYQQKYGVIFTVLLALFNENQPVDLITCQNRLKTMNVPQEWCTLEFLSSIVKAVPTAANIRHYAQIVADKAVLRRLIKAGETIQNSCYLDRDGLDSILEESEKQVFDIVQHRHTSEIASIQDIVINALDDIENSSKNRGSVTGVSTGFIELDYKTAGLQKSDLILLAARPSMGKTALALNIAEHAILKGEVPTAFFSLEMSSKQLVNRLLSMNSKVEAQSIRTGNLSEDDWSALVESARAIGSSKLYIDDTPGITVGEFRSKCRKLKMEHNIGLIIIDYLQLMNLGRRIESRQQEISEISRTLKAVAREVDCPILALSQLSRACESRPDKRPMLSDLRESGAIEQDADVVMFIYRDEYYDHDSKDKGIAEVIIGKQRNGPTGTIKLACQLEYTRFKNLAKE